MAEEATSFSDLPRFVLETYRDEYRDLSESWRHLDTKAQGLGAIAGIFLAAVFTWTHELPASFGRSERILVVGSILLLVLAIVAAVAAIGVRRVAAPPLGDEIGEMVSDILRKQKAEELPERLAAFWNDQITAWKDTNRDMRQHTESKAFRITLGQVTLMLAAGLVAVLWILPILSTL
jgi:predicted PurR-regulated permease PerM